MITPTFDYYYRNLIADILHRGIDNPSRTENITRRSINFPEQLRIDMRDQQLPMLHIKPVSVNNIISELLWFISGASSIIPMLEQNNKIWLSDCFRYQVEKAYENNDQLFLSKFNYHKIAYAKNIFEKTGDFSDAQKLLDKFQDFIMDMPYYSIVGVSYPYFWKSFINSLTKDSFYAGNTRLVMSSWDNLNKDHALPPCHYSMQILVNEDYTFDLMWNQRSVDVILGLPYNVLSYAIFMRMIQSVYDLTPRYLIGTFADTHIYSAHNKASEEILQRYDSVDNEHYLDASVSQQRYDFTISPSTELSRFKLDNFSFNMDKPKKLNNATPMIGGII